MLLIKDRFYFLNGVAVVFILSSCHIPQSRFSSTLLIDNVLIPKCISESWRLAPGYFDSNL